MAMSDCVKCWDTPCTCGYEYRNYSKRSRIKLAAAILGVHHEALEIRVRSMLHEKHPQADPDEPIVVAEEEKGELQRMVDRTKRQSQHGCSCKYSDAWRCAKSTNSPELACTCSCHKIKT
jgi:hypothetical protein